MRRHTIARRQKAKEKCKRVEKVIADRGYNTHRIFRDMYERGIEPCILPRSSARISGNIGRDKVIRLIRRGKRAWKEASGYGKRWLVESFFSVFKRWFGEYLSHMKIENIRKAVMLKVRCMWYSINREWNFDRSLKFASLDRADLNLCLN